MMLLKKNGKLANGAGCDKKAGCFVGADASFSIFSILNICIGD